MGGGGERERERERVSDLSYSRIKILGKSLVLQSVLANYNTHIYAKYSGVAKMAKDKVKA